MPAQQRGAWEYVACCLALVSLASAWLLLDVEPASPAWPPPTETAAERASVGVGGEDRGAVQPSSGSGRPARTSAATGADLGRPPEGSGAVVRGRVLDQDDAGVAAVTVRLVRGAHERRARTDALGGFELAGLPRGLYTLHVEAGSLPPGVLPPARPPPGPRARVVRITGEGEHSVDLRVVVAGSVRGRVVDPDGEPVARALVAIRGDDDVQALARTDAAGSFALERVHPGSYTTRVELAARSGTPRARAPLPQRFSVAARDQVELADLVVGSGGHVLQGVVLDERDRPVAGLLVVCREALDEAGRELGQDRTDERGRFRIGRVPPCPLVVGVSAREGGGARGNGRVPGELPALQVDARAGPETIDVGSLRVELGRPFQVAGSVHVDPTWARARGLEPWRARVEVHSVAGAGASGAGVAGTLLGVVPDASAGFAWACATPPAEVELRVLLSDAAGNAHRRTLRLRPRPDATEDLVVTFP